MVNTERIEYEREIGGDGELIASYRVAHLRNFSINRLKVLPQFNRLEIYIYDVQALGIALSDSG